MKKKDEIEDIKKLWMKERFNQKQNQLERLYKQQSFKKQKTIDADRSEEFRLKAVKEEEERWI